VLLCQLQQWHKVAGSVRFQRAIITSSAHHRCRPPPPAKTMSIIQVVINGNQVQGEIEQIAAILGMNSSIMVQPAQQVVTNQEEKSIKFVEFFGIELENHIKGGKLFVSELNKLYRKGSGYRSMIRVYHDLVNKGTKGWAKRRQLLLTSSAIWRYTFKGSQKSKLRYQIEAVIECEDCGEFATVMVKKMIAEKLWK
jgi:hypothetical protein